jgi:acetyl-CoA synthetase
MICELPAAMLACARIGAVHSVVFAGFSAEALAGRIVYSCPKLVLTCSAVRRANKVIDLKKIVDEALDICDNEEQVHIPRVLVYDHVDAVKHDPNYACHFHAPRDERWQDVVPLQSKECEVVWVDAEHPLFRVGLGFCVI